MTNNGEPGKDIGIERPRLNPAFIPIAVDESTLEFRVGPWNGPVHTLKDTDGNSHIHSLVELLDGSNHTEDILNQFGGNRSEIRNVINQLYEKRVIYDNAQIENPHTWGYTALRADVSERQFNRIKDANIVIINNTKVASILEEELGELNVANVRVLDFGLVDGDASDVYSVLEESELIVHTATAVKTGSQSHINSIALKTGTPMLPIHVYNTDILVGPAIFPGETACYSCFEERLSANTKVPERIGQCFNNTERNLLNVNSISYVAAGYAFATILQLITVGTSHLTSRLLHSNMMSMETSISEVLKLPRCSECGETGFDLHRFTTLDEVFKEVE